MPVTKSNPSPWSSGDKVDSIGYHHNQILEALIMSDEFSEDGQVVDIVEILTEQYFGNAYEVPGVSKDDFTSVFTINHPYVTIDYTYVKTHYVLSAQVTESLELFLNGLLESRYSDYADFKSWTIDMENALIFNDSIPLTEEEENLLLGVTSVARHSGYYWFHQHQIKDGFLGFLAAADACGALVGALSGGNRLKNAAYGAAVFSGLGALTYGSRDW